MHELCLDILKQHNQKLAITALIRGITEAVLDLDIELEITENEAEIYQLVKSTIKSRQILNKDFD